MAGMALDDMHRRLAQSPHPFVPEPVAEPGGGRAGAREAYQQKRREHARMLGRRAHAGHEFLDLIDDAVDIAGPDRMVAAGQFDKTRAPDFFRQIAPSADLDARVVGAMDDHRGYADRRQHRAYVDRRVHARERDRGGRTRRQPLIAAPPVVETLVPALVRRKARDAGAGPPSGFDAADEIVKRFTWHHPSVKMRVGAVEHKRARALGIGRREQDGHRSAFRDTEQDGALAADGIHHRAHVGHAGLQRGQTVDVDAVAQAGAALVEHDQPRECAKACHQMAEARVFPLDLEIGNVAGNENQIDRTLADHLIGDAHIAVAGVSRLGKHHGVAPAVWLVPRLVAASIAHRPRRGRFGYSRADRLIQAFSSPSSPSTVTNSARSLSR